MSDTLTVVSLKNAGDSITLGVASCKLMEIGKYPEVEFIGNDGARDCAVRVPKASCDRQMGRMGFAPGTYDRFAGMIINISRDENRTDPSKPYWGIKLAGAMPKANGKPPVQRVAPEDLPDEPPPIEEAYNQVQVRTNNLTDLFALYDACYKHAQGMATQDVAAMAATLFIEANKRGIRA